MNFITAFYFGPICPWISPNLGLFLAPMFRADLTPNRSKLHSYGRTSPKPDRSFGRILPQIGPNLAQWFWTDFQKSARLEYQTLDVVWKIGPIFRNCPCRHSANNLVSGFGRISRNRPDWGATSLEVISRFGRIFGKLAGLQTNL